MVFNVLLESFIGLIQFLDDLFDLVWKANEKNIGLLEKQLAGPKLLSSPEHCLESVVIIIFIILFAGIIGIAYLGFSILFAVGTVFFKDGWAG